MKVLDESGLPALWEAIINTCPRMEFGSYVGSGSYGGSSSANTLTFDFEPRFLMIFSDTGTMHAGNRMDYDDGTLESLPAIGCPAALTTSFASGLFVAYSGMYAKKSEDGKVVSWYAGYSAAYQLNSSGTTYYYLALG